MAQNQKVSCKGIFEVSTRTLKTEEPAHRDTRSECALCMSFLEIRPGNIRTRYRNGYGMNTGTEKRRKEGVREWHRHRDS